MKVIYDYQMIIGQKYGGISRYFYELTVRFGKNNEITSNVICLFNDNAYFLDGKNRPNYCKIPGRGYANRLITKMILKYGHYDIFHPTYYDQYFLNYNKGKLVITVYDMIHELMPQYFKDANIIVENKKALLYKADCVIAISENTKTDIIKLYPDIDENKIRVIYISSNFKKTHIVADDISFPQKYVLFVGTRSDYKNYDKFFDSMVPILMANKDLHLVCVGGGNFTDSELKKQEMFSNRIHQMNVNDKILSYAYSHALCFVFPSLYEGFGIPTLEAFACDCPVVLSNTSSMPEVGGDAVEYINPYDINNMTLKISEVINNENLRADMIKKGREQLKKFNWDVIAKQTLECYREVLNEGKE